jgi:response regulator RpfG family c-di-GMP phosphodiesterase
MSLFSRKKPEEPPPPPPAQPPPPRSQPSKADSTLKLELPDVFAFREDATRASIAARVSDETKLEQGRGFVLLVESDDEIRRLLSRLLQHEGYTLHTVTCLAEAREALKTQPAGFVLARRACVPLNLDTDIALRDVRQKANVRVVDDFSELILGQVVDYESMSQCVLALSGLLASLLEGAYTSARGHAQTVAKYSRLVGQRLGLNRRDLDALTLAACLHDVGSLETDHRISQLGVQDGQPLLSPSLHSSLELLANIPVAYPINDLLAAATENAAAHEDESLPPTPLGARILRVVETYDTLRRCHRDQFAEENALFEWMRRQPAGTFDLDALETLIHIRRSEHTINSMDLFRETVLLISLHPEELEILSLRLQNDDYHILTARSITEALDQLRAHHVTLVLTSYHLQGETTGFDLLRSVKNDPAMRDIPVVFHDIPQTDLVKHALELGAEDWYPKPYNIEIIALKISRILQRFRVRPAATEGVHGNLRDMALIDMVQILCAGLRSVHIQLQRDDDHAELLIHKGQIANAKYRDLEGEDAALAVLQWTEGSFSIRPLREAPPARITASTDSLLHRSCASEDRRNTTRTTAP